MHLQWNAKTSMLKTLALKHRCLRLQDGGPS